jgi:hypothetical protein
VTDHRIRRWFQLSLKSLFLLTLLVATFFAGYRLATKQYEQDAVFTGIELQVYQGHLGAGLSRREARARTESFAERMKLLRERQQRTRR